MPAESLLGIKKRPIDEVLKGFKSESNHESHQAGVNLLRESAKFGLSVKDYLTLSITTRGTELSGMGGWDAAKVFLNLPVADDFKEGIVLQAASETFQTFPGTRALFPPVIDDMLIWAKRQDAIEQLEPLLAVSRTINGPELLFTIVNDDGSEYTTAVVAELGRIPIRSLRTSESSVKMFKHGSGIRTSYEFNRRARLDLLTPFASRVQRELVLSKIRAAVNTLVNGDTVAPAATVVNQSSYNAQVGTASTNGTLSYNHLLAWLVARAKAGTPVDTVIGNWDAMFQWMKLFSPTIQGNVSAADVVRAQSGIGFTIPMPFPQVVNFAVASAAPAAKLIGITRAETLEELKEAGSDIAEEERSIGNQSITYVRTENTGYRLVFKDTRSILDYNA